MYLLRRSCALGHIILSLTVSGIYHSLWGENSTQNEYPHYSKWVGFSSHIEWNIPLPLTMSGIFHSTLLDMRGILHSYWGIIYECSTALDHSKWVVECSTPLNTQFEWNSHLTVSRIQHSKWVAFTTHSIWVLNSTQIYIIIKDTKPTEIGYINYIIMIIANI